MVVGSHFLNSAVNCQSAVQRQEVKHIVPCRLRASAVITMTDSKMREEKPHFIPPVIQDNPTGWGPSEMPEQFRDMPYQPFSKGDRLGKISDWTGAAFQDKKYASKYASQFGSGSQYAYYHDEDESTFHLVDTTRVQKPPYQRGRFKANQRNMRGRGIRGGMQSGMQALGKGLKARDRDRKNQIKKWGQGRPQIKIRDASVTVRPDWVTIEEMDFPRLGKLSLPSIKDVPYPLQYIPRGWRRSSCAD